LRDDFSPKVKTIVAKRVGYLCSNPNCRRPTTGPHSDGGKSTSIGVAAHITAASSGGPRYASEITAETRSSGENAIWLCQSCAKVVDNDPKVYTKDTIVAWKHGAETAALMEIRQPRVKNPMELSVTGCFQLTPLPSNVFEFLGPGITLERMRSLLNAPHRSFNGQYSYTFSNALLQIISSNDKYIDSVAVAIRGIGEGFQFDVYPYGDVLGTLKVDQLLAEDFSIEHQSSMKHEELILRGYYGMPGLYRHFTYGALKAPFIWESEFAWDTTENILITDPSQVLLNWAAVSSQNEEIWFDFWSFF
jgi:hypothetical protein